MINLANYETFALDYLEGNLSEVQTAAMHAFLAKNPAIRAELNSFSLAPLTADENIVFAGKNNLQKQETVAPKIVALPSYSNYYRAAAVAASAIFIFGAGIYLYKNNFEQKENTKFASAVNPDTVQSIIHSKNTEPTNDAAPLVLPLVLPKNAKNLAENTPKNENNLAENTNKNELLQKNKKNTPSPVTLTNLAAINYQTKAKNTVKNTNTNIGKNTPQNEQEFLAKNTTTKENEKNIAPAVTFPNIETINKQEVANKEKTAVTVFAALQPHHTIQDFYFETDENPTTITDNSENINIAQFAHQEPKSAKKNALRVLTPETSFDKSETKFWEAFVPSTRNKSDDRATAFLNSLQPETLR